MITIKTLNAVQRELNDNKDFVQSNEYCVIEPGLTHFNQDEIINHADLIKYAEEYTLDAFHVIPHLTIQ